MRYFVFQAPVTGEITAKVLCEDTDDLTADGGIEVTREDFDAVRLPEPPARPAPEPPEQELSVWEQLDQAYQEGVNEA